MLETFILLEMVYLHRVVREKKNMTQEELGSKVRKTLFYLTSRA